LPGWKGRERRGPVPTAPSSCLPCYPAGLRPKGVPGYRLARSYGITS